jgi:UDP-2,4-diacetamido-2,4,6-trideoxy-beta-L-altropyranose hydrolase
MGTGLGHLTRCLALARGFQERNIETLFICRDQPLAVQFIQSQGIKPLLLPVSASQQQDLEATLRFSANCDLIIVDHLNFTSDYLAGLHQGKRWTAFFDDQAEQGLPVDIVIGNGYITPERYGARPPTHLLSGPSFLPLRSEFQQLAKGQIARQIAPEVQELLLTFGGEDPHNVTLQLLEALRGVTRTMRVNLLVGAAYRHLDQLQAAISRHPLPIQLFHNLSHLLPLFQRSDLAITAASTTFWELAATGTPSLIVQTAENQGMMAAYVEQERLGASLGWYRDLDPERILKAVESMGSRKIRQEYSERCQRLVDGGGVKRLVDQLIAIVSDR